MKRQHYLSVLLVIVTIFAAASSQAADYSGYLQNTNEVEPWPAKVESEQPTALTTAPAQKYYTNWSVNEAEQKVTRIGNELKSANGIDMAMNFCVVDTEDVNATTDISNNISVYNGILPYLENEDELAFIIGHEMGHAVSKHVVKSIATDTTADVANTVGKQVLQSKITGVAASKLNGMGFGLGNVAGNTIKTAGDASVDVATTATASTFQRGRENDADLLAIDFLVKQGYNPLAGISIMTKIGDVYPDLFVDHPSTDKRVVTMYNYISKNYPQYISKGFGTEAYSTALNNYIK